MHETINTKLVRCFPPLFLASYMLCDPKFGTWAKLSILLSILALTFPTFWSQPPEQQWESAWVTRPSWDVLLLKSQLTAAIPVDGTLKCLINAATNLSSPTQITITRELWSCSDSLLHMRTSIRTFTHGHLLHSTSSSNATFQKKKTYSSLQFWVFFFVIWLLFLFLFGDSFVFLRWLSYVPQDSP